MYTSRDCSPKLLNLWHLYFRCIFVCFFSMFSMVVSNPVGCATHAQNCEGGGYELLVCAYKSTLSEDCHRKYLEKVWLQKNHHKCTVQPTAPEISLILRQ